MTDMFTAPDAIMLEEMAPSTDMAGSDMSAQDMTAPVVDMVSDQAPDLAVNEDMSSTGVEPRTRARVVFSGHSLTDASVPTVRRLAREQGVDLVDIYQAIPGSPVGARTRGGREEPPTWSGYASGTPDGINLINELRQPTRLPGAERYDTLMITERHDLLGVVQWESTVSLLRHFHDRLLESSPEGTTYLYHSWLSVKKDNPVPWIRYEKDALVAWECVSSKINLTLQEDNRPQNVKTIATGWALAHMVEAALAGSIPGLSGSSREVLDQIFSDDVHMTPLGSLFTGAFTYSALFGQDPSQAQIPEGIAEGTGRAMLVMARELAQRYRALPAQGTHEMSACRAHITTTMCEPFWTYFSDNAGAVQGCRNYFGSTTDNPFQWPDPTRKIWPAP